MITKKNLIVAVLCTFCLTMVLFSTMPVKSAGVYDPWVDVNHDGKINVLDLIKVATGLNTAGDPALNVTVANAPSVWVANFPTAGDVCVWYDVYVGPSQVWSAMQNANGYTYMHVLVNVASPLSSATLTVALSGVLWNSVHTSCSTTTVYTATVTSSQQQIGFTSPVPSQNWYFVAWIVGSQYSYDVRLSYYLTWG